MHTLHYKTEVLSRKELITPKTKVSDAELDMAVSLVKAMAKSFKPEEYKDEYREALKRVIEAKIRGKKIVIPAVPKAEIGDLMAELRASIAAAKKEPAFR